ncbi:MAG: hypothetical protein ACR2MM_08920 [Flavobacteriaceae bacterium]
MKKSILLLLLMVPCMGISQKTGLEGLWIIDLRPSPESPGYFQEFEVTKVSETGLEGSFYDSPIENGLVNKNWDQLYFAFTTRDQTFEYYHSGYMKDGKLFGNSYCPGREFTAPWTAKRK